MAQDRAIEVTVVEAVVVRLETTVKEEVGENKMKEVQLKAGKVILKAPNAGARNKALMKAETPEGIKNTILMVELLPYCIVSHPFGTANLRQSLDNLDVAEYDKLILALAESMQIPGGEDTSKKLEEPSEQEKSPEVGSAKK